MRSTKTAHANEVERRVGQKLKEVHDELRNSKWEDEKWCEHVYEKKIETWWEKVIKDWRIRFDLYMKVELWYDGDDDS